MHGTVLAHIPFPRDLFLDHDWSGFAKLRHLVAKAVCHKKDGLSDYVPILTKNNFFRPPDWTRNSGAFEGKSTSSFRELRPTKDVQRTCWMGPKITAIGPSRLVHCDFRGKRNTQKTERCPVRDVEDGNLIGQKSEVLILRYKKMLFRRVWVFIFLRQSR